ncbi:hypothetical protein QAD02_007203 [Eretmocerus hayati]|uniref:Uncharacterized protein n=1 Tax=Eretmocerus hayati TaxID=131215 RepID=A0ACC2N3C0_9HYME|nr:hypothetical protein QAD02_007203 [Eretmocerus hayati]
MLEGDNLYSRIRNLSSLSRYAIDRSGFLHVRNFDTIRESFIMYNQDFSINYEDDTDLFGTSQDNMNDGQLGRSLGQSLRILFTNHSSGILIVQNSSFGVINCNESYYLTDSHSWDSRGCPVPDGRACIIHCDTLEALIDPCKIKFGNDNVVYNLRYVEVITEYDPVLDEIILSQSDTGEHPIPIINDHHSKCPASKSPNILVPSVTPAAPCDNGNFAHSTLPCHIDNSQQSTLKTDPRHNLAPLEIDNQNTRADSLRKNPSLFDNVPNNCVPETAKYVSCAPNPLDPPIIQKATHFKPKSSSLTTKPQLPPEEPVPPITVLNSKTNKATSATEKPYSSNCPDHRLYPYLHIGEHPHSAANNTECYQPCPIQTSIMLPNDACQPDVEDLLLVTTYPNEIIRKTDNNIVNTDHELRAEEYAWYHLFPFGINGLREPNRAVPITPLDYSQHRILGSDKRFQRNDYLFYALSHYEYRRVKSNIAACGEKIRSQDGMVEDLHLYLQSLRGSAA